MKFSKDLAGALVVPGIAVIYALHSLWELTTGAYRPATVIYTYVIVVPLIFLAAIIVVRAFLKGDPSEDIGGETEVERAAVVWEGRGKRLFLVIAMTFALIATMTWVGYVFGFFIYVSSVLWIMNVREIKPILIIAVVMTMIVHFVFAIVLDQDLPQGVLEPLFEMLEDK